MNIAQPKTARTTTTIAPTTIPRPLLLKPTCCKELSGSAEPVWANNGEVGNKTRPPSFNIQILEKFQSPKLGTREARCGSRPSRLKAGLQTVGGACEAFARILHALTAFASSATRSCHPPRQFPQRCSVAA